MRLTRLADWLRGEGLTVVEHTGWATLQRPTGFFRPVGVLWHHTATRSDQGNPAPSVALVTRGRSDLPGPLCQLLPAWDGRVHLIAAGRANHAGSADGRGTGPIPAGDGNDLLVGLEIDYNPDHQDGPSPAQYRASIAAAAAVLRYLRAIGQVPAESPAAAAERARSHAETSTTGKWDPGRAGRRSIPMGPWRDDLAAALAQPPGAWYTGAAEEDDVTPEDRAAIVAGVTAALQPTIAAAAAQAAAAATAAARAGATAAQALAAAEAAHQAATDTAATVTLQLADARARAPRVNTRRYDRPGVATYDQLGQAAPSYIDLSGQLAGVTAAAPSPAAMREALDGLLPTTGTITLTPAAIVPATV